MNMFKFLIKIILALFIVFGVKIAEAQNTVSASGGISQYSSETGDPVVVDPDITLSTEGTISSAAVIIGQGFAPAEDRLIYPTVLHGITGDYDATSGVLLLTGEGTAQQYQDVFRSILYNNTAAAPQAGDRIISFSLGDALPHFPCGATEPHFYKLINEHGNNWNDAKADAQTLTHYGFQGYLATIICEEENAFITEKLDASAFIGATDEETEGTWKWDTGPEAGTVFWQDDQILTYSNWNLPGEPNNTASSEHYACIYGQSHPSWGETGFWNDVRLVPDPGDLIAGYVVEFGGMPDDPVQSISDTKTVNVITYPINSFEITGTEVCAGSSAEIILASSEIGVSYTFYMDETEVAQAEGSGEELSVTIAAEYISSANQIISAEATNGSLQTNMQDTALIVQHPLPDETLEVSGTQICPGETAQITVHDSETNTVYQTFILSDTLSQTSGNGSDAYISVQDTALSIGENIIEVAASNENCSTILSDTALVSLNGFNLTDVYTTGDEIIGAEDGTISISPSSSDYQYVLYETPDSVQVLSEAGNDNILELTVPNAFLEEKENDFDIYVFNKTCKLFLGTEQIINLASVDIPRGFSPNGNSINDYFVIDGIEKYPNNTVEIYNRWGTKVYSASSYDNRSVAWNGRVSGGFRGEEKLPEGTYFYVIILEESSAPLKGTVYLKR